MRTNRCVGAPGFGAFAQVDANLGEICVMLAKKKGLIVCLAGPVFDPTAEMPVVSDRGFKTQFELLAAIRIRSRYRCRAEYLVARIESRI